MQGPKPASIRAGHWRVGGLLTGAAGFWTGWLAGRVAGGRRSPSDADIPA